MIKLYQDIISSLPSKPGIYQFISSDGSVLYVGKAGNLRKRVSSYFSGEQSGKTRMMLSRAETLRHMVVESESDALLLENNLIKKHQPRYNILLKDDKTFPWICIKKEPFPRVFSTRNVVNDGSAYFGPYTSALMVKTLITLIRRIFQIRTCSYRLTEENIKGGRLKVCLEYHLGNCKAPCIGLQTEEDHMNGIGQIREILRGNISSVIDHLKNIMLKLSEEMRYEEAQKVKEKIELLSHYKSKSTIVSTTIGNVEVYGYTEESGVAFINFLRVIHGAVIQTYTLEIRSRMDEGRETLLGLGITEIRSRTGSDSKEIIVPFLPDIQADKLIYTLPEVGDKRKLLDLALRNAIYSKLEERKKGETGKEQSRTGRNLEKVKNDLHLPVMPDHIECFDNSNIQGASPVAACVVFRNGKPSKKEYRHFNIKSVKGPDDFSSMEEVILRRYKRLTDEGKPIPSLVVIDGGKGQLSAAVRSIEKLGLRGKTTLVGIAKKLEEIYFPGDSVPIYLDKNSYTLKLIQQLRNEAHRFGINFHRDKRSASMIASVLDKIKGIGPKTKELLLKEFDSVDEIRNYNKERLEKLVGRRKSELLLNFLAD